MIDAEPRLLEARRGRSLSYHGKTLLSVFDPIAQADRIAQAALRRDKTLYFCPSPLFGYGLETLRSQMSADSAILCVECDDQLTKLSQAEIPAEFIDSPHCAFVHTAEPTAICAFVHDRWGARAFRRVEMVRLSGGWALAEKNYESMVDALRADIAVHWSNAMTLVRLGRRYALNTARNLALLPEASRLDQIDFGEAPTLVLGAGPSMDAIADRIAAETIRTRTFKIVCVDTALMALLSRGIEPDLVVALEAQHWNLKDFVGTACPERPLAVDLSAHPGTAAAGGGPIILFATRWTSLRFLDRLEASRLLPPELPPLGSVGLTAVAAALRTTKGPIVVAGLDFAYSLDAYHARSTPSRHDRERKSTRLLSLIDPAPAFRTHVAPVRVGDGIFIRSDPALRGYRDLFLREFSSVRRLADAGTRGLDLGIPRLHLEDAFSLLTSKQDGEPQKGTGRDRTAEDRDTRDRATLRERVLSFVNDELEMLARLRDALSGKDAATGTELDRLLDECDYLWAHFPECAGAEGKRPASGDLSFLKRVRAEIEPFSKAFTLAQKELSNKS